MTYFRTMVPRSHARTAALLTLTAGLLSACGGTPASPPPGGTPGTLTVSGTVQVPTGAAVDQTMVVVCAVNGDSCDEVNYKAVRLTTSGTQAPFEVSGLPTGKYYVFAWKDANQSAAIDDGDLFGAYSTDGQAAAVVTASKTNVALNLTVQGGDIGNVVTGQVHSAGALLPDRTVVFTCVLTAQGGCDEGQAVASGVTPQGQYLLEHVPAGPFMVIAWQDTNNDRALSPDDLYGVYQNVQGAAERVQAPRQGIDVHLGQLPSATSAPTGQVPAALTGVWVSGTNTGTSYYNPSSGSWAPESGTGTYLKIGADGTFAKSGLLQSSVYSCSITFYSHAQGVTHFNGDEITLEAQVTHQKYNSTCTPGNNYDRITPNTSSSFKWALLDDGRLRMTWPDGNITYYTRAQ